MTRESRGESLFARKRKPAPVVTMVCAWCPPIPGPLLGLVSHGICARHKEETLRELAQLQKKGAA